MAMARRAHRVVAVLFCGIFAAIAAVGADPGVDPSRLAARFEDHADSTGWLALDFHRDRWAFVVGTVNGVETPIAVDSGAAITVLDRSFAETLGLELTDAGEADGAGGSQRFALTHGVRFAIGKFRLELGTVAVIDFSEVARHIGRRLPVVLGKEAFLVTVVDMDLPRSRLAFRVPEDFEHDGGGNSIPLGLSDDGMIQVEARVEGRALAPFDVDTGSGGCLDLLSPYVDSQKFLDGRGKMSKRLSGGVGGTIVHPIGTLSSFELAGYELHGVPAEFQQKAVGAFDTEAMAGNIGMGILRRFRLVFDMRRGVLHVVPGPGWDAPFKKDRSGLQVIPDGRALEVVYVAPGSPAERAGWTIGNRIATVNGILVDEDYFEGLSEWQYGEPGSAVVLVDGRGRERKLVLADYY